MTNLKPLQRANRTNNFRLLKLYLEPICVELQSNWSPILADLRHLLAPYCSTPKNNSHPIQTIEYKAVWQARNQCFELHHQGKILSTTQSALELLAFLQDHVFWYWCSQVKDRLMVHATAIARGNEALLLVASKHSGKSTTSLYCLQQGFTYVADDIVSMELKTGDIFADPWPVRVKEEVFPLAPEVGLYTCRSGDTQYAVIDPRWCANKGKRFKVKAIIVPQYNPEEESQLIPVGQGWGAYKLLRHAFNQPHLGLEGFETAIELAKKIPCYQLQHNDLHVAYEMLNSLYNQ